MDSLTSRHIRWALILLTAVIITGCENSNRLGDGHDFSDNDQNVYLALGDSITYGYGLSSQATYSVKLSAMIGKTVINAGIGGETSFGGTTKVNSLLARYKPGYLLILYGANDLIIGHSTTTIGNLRYIIQ